MSKQIEIREMCNEDLNNIIRIQAESYPSVLQEDISLFKNILNASHPFCFMALSEQKSLGYILGYVTDENRNDFEMGPRFSETQGDVVYLHDLCVDPSCRGQSIAKNIYNTFEKKVLQEGYKKIIAISLEEAVCFWEKRGFYQEGDFPYHGQKAYKISKDLKG